MTGDIRDVWMVARGHFSGEYDEHDLPSERFDSLFMTREDAIGYVTGQLMPVQLSRCGGKLHTIPSLSENYGINGFASPVEVENDTPWDGTLLRFAIVADGVTLEVWNPYGRDEFLVYKRKVGSLPAIVTGDGEWAVYAVVRSRHPKARLVARFPTKESAEIYLRMLDIDVSYRNGSECFRSDFDPSEDVLVGHASLHTDDGTVYRYRFGNSNMPVRGPHAREYVLMRDGG